MSTESDCFRSQKALPKSNAWRSQEGEEVEEPWLPRFCHELPADLGPVTRETAGLGVRAAPRALPSEGCCETGWREGGRRTGPQSDHPPAPERSHRRRGPRRSLTGPGAPRRSRYCSSLRTPGPPRKPGAWPVPEKESERARLNPQPKKPGCCVHRGTEHPHRPTARLSSRGRHRRCRLRSCSSQSTPAPFKRGGVPVRARLHIPGCCAPLRPADVPASRFFRLRRGWDMMPVKPRAIGGRGAFWEVKFRCCQRGFLRGRPGFGKRFEQRCNNKPKADATIATDL